MFRHDIIVPDLSCLTDICCLVFLGRLMTLEALRLLIRSEVAIIPAFVDEGDPTLCLTLLHPR